MTDEDLRKQILTDLQQDIAMEGLDFSGVQLGEQLCARVDPETDQLINSSGSGIIVQIILNEEIFGSVVYIPGGWNYNKRFGPAGNMFQLLDTIRGEQGYHYSKYNGEL